jgi:hypothetical protein
VAQLSEWLQIMLAEIARKQAEARHAAEEQQRRLVSPPLPPAPSSVLVATPGSRAATATPAQRIHAL